MFVEITLNESSHRFELLIRPESYRGNWDDWDKNPIRIPWATATRKKSVDYIKAPDKNYPNVKRAVGGGFDEYAVTNFYSVRFQSRLRNKDGEHQHRKFCAKFRVCPHCHSHIYDSGDYRFYRTCEMKADWEHSDSGLLCPICLSHIDNASPSNRNAPSDVSLSPKALPRMHYDASETYELPELTEDIKQKINQNGTESLAALLGTIMSAEATIEEMEKRRKYLSGLRDAQREILVCKEVARISQAYQADFNSNVNSDVACVDIPRPVAPKKPEEPILITPGFFNKKEVQKENAEAIEHYNQLMEVYEQKQAAYQEKMNAYRKACNEAQKERIRQRAQHDGAVESFAKDMVNCLETYQPASIEIELINAEISQAEYSLKRALKLRNMLYGTDVVFEKYRNYPAVATMYDYLKSGRCSTLEGPDGAYNLYESEKRANLIITKLDDISTTLHDIRDNQYTLMRQLKEINASVNQMNHDLGEALDQLTGVTAAGLGEIAYNTQMTAYYAKRNAELTNALGYLVAFT